MPNSFIPARLYVGNRAKGKIHNVIYLWSESWSKTDDWFFVWERQQFKPYYRNYITDINGVDIYPHYHFTEETFNTELDNFLNHIPLTPISYYNHIVYLIVDFRDEFWAYDPEFGMIVVSHDKPKLVERKVDKETLRGLLRDEIMKLVMPRVKFANHHLNHLDFTEVRA